MPALCCVCVCASLCVKRLGEACGKRKGARRLKGGKITRTMVTIGQMLTGTVGAEVAEHSTLSGSCGDAFSPESVDAPRRKGVTGLVRLPLASILSASATPVLSHRRDIRVINAGVESVGWEIPVGEDSRQEVMDQEAVCSDTQRRRREGGGEGEPTSPLDDAVDDIKRLIDFLPSPRCQTPRVACLGHGRGPVSDDLATDCQTGSVAPSTQGHNCPSESASTSPLCPAESPAPDGVSAGRALAAPLLSAPSRGGASTDPACAPALAGPGKSAASDVSRWMALPTARLSDEDREMVCAEGNFGKEVLIGRHFYLAC